MIVGRWCFPRYGDGASIAGWTGDPSVDACHGYRLPWKDIRREGRAAGGGVDGGTAVLAPELPAAAIQRVRRPFCSPFRPPHPCPRSLPPLPVPVVVVVVVVPPHLLLLLHTSPAPPSSSSALPPGFPGRSVGSSRLRPALSSSLLKGGIVVYHHHHHHQQPRRVLPFSPSGDGTHHRPADDLQLKVRQSHASAVCPLRPHLYQDRTSQAARALPYGKAFSRPSSPVESACVSPLFDYNSFPSPSVVDRGQWWRAGGERDTRLDWRMSVVSSWS